MTRFSSFTDDELDMMEEAFCNEGLKYFVFEIRKERSLRQECLSRQKASISKWQSIN